MSTNNPIRTMDPMGDSCCREATSRPGKLVSTGASGVPDLFVHKCEACGRAWMRYAGKKPFTLTNDAMETGGFGPVMRGIVK